MWLLRWNHCKVLNTGPGRASGGWAEVRGLVSRPSVPAPGRAVSNGHSGTPAAREVLGVLAGSFLCPWAGRPFWGEVVAGGRKGLAFLEPALPSPR